jgi:ankyrin repeat protein
MVEGLVIVGANANTKTKRELAVMFETVPLIHAVSLVAEGNSDDTLLTLLLDNGADVNATNAYRWTALLEAVSQDRLALVKLLVERGADVNAAQNQGETPLMTAVSRGNKEIVTYLLAQGADVNRKNEEGKTALILAIERGQAYVVAPLLIKAEVNLADNNGHTALMQAAIGGDSYLVKELLNAGADPQLKDARGKTAANYAEQYNHQEIINLFTD